jgi:hypothetical protein
MDITVSTMHGGAMDVIGTTPKRWPDGKGGGGQGGRRCEQSRPMMGSTSKSATDLPLLRGGSFARSPRE